MPIAKLAWLALAGACGTLARYALSGLVYRWLGSGFPWGTAMVNIAGCLLFGFLWELSVERGLLPLEVRTVVLVGFMGAFTTFSTFIAETGFLAADAEILLALGNVALQVTTGTAVFFLGLVLGRLL